MFSNIICFTNNDMFRTKSWIKKLKSLNNIVRDNLNDYGKVQQCVKALRSA